MLLGTSPSTTSDTGVAVLVVSRNQEIGYEVDPDRAEKADFLRPVIGAPFASVTETAHCR